MGPEAAERTGPAGTWTRAGSSEARQRLANSPQTPSTRLAQGPPRGGHEGPSSARLSSTWQ